MGKKARERDSKTKIVTVTSATKERLDAFRRDFPEVKQLYFVSTAIDKAIDAERATRLVSSER